MHNYSVQTLASKCFFVVKTFTAPGATSLRGNIVVRGRQGVSQGVSATVAQTSVPIPALKTRRSFNAITDIQYLARYKGKKRQFAHVVVTVNRNLQVQRAGAGVYFQGSTGTSALGDGTGHQIPPVLMAGTYIHETHWIAQEGVIQNFQTIIPGRTVKIIQIVTSAPLSGSIDPQSLLPVGVEMLPLG
ncbi:hypothetical protein V496_07605 [Pseudogymnoascus sp. VKM F-4515 (FW-2607)]|nr:hypothetical protein V496_07605 [Pseudogymnoascus sp. VKM F-4515 (FW-2607)]